MSLPAIRGVLAKKFPEKLVDELIECYQDQKKNFFLGNLRPNEVEGGRFCEAAFRMLQHYCLLTVTPIGNHLNTDGLITQLANLPSANFNDSVRIHIPRTLRVIYDIRNKRDAAHLMDGIDPNLQDSSFVFSSLDWVLAEFIRLSAPTNISPDQAHALVKAVTVHAIPAIEDFNGFLKTLKPSLGASERILLLLYHRYTKGASVQELSDWIKPSQRTNLKRTLKRMEHDKDYVINKSNQYFITRLGILEVSKQKLLEL